MVVHVRMEITTCDLCGSSEASPVHQGTDLMIHTTDQLFTLVRCKQCGLVYMNPRPFPSEMGRFYPPEYEPYSFHIPRFSNPWREKLFFYGIDKRARLIHTLTGKKRRLRLLDIGCSSGVFLARLQKVFGWDVYGVEPNREAAQFAREKYGLEQVTTGTLDEVHYPDAYFDAVTLWNVLEHLYSPDATLKEIRRILKPGGLLVCAVPNLAGLDAKLFGKYWQGYELPRHLYHFTPRTLSKLFRKNGFRIVKQTGLSGEHNFLLLSLRLWMQAHLPDPVRRAIELCWMSPPFKLLLSPFLFLYDKLNLGTVTTVFARLHTK